MSYFFCPTKKKNVIAYKSGIPVSTMEDLKPSVIDGRVECSGSDAECTKDKCPLLKGRIKKERGG